MAYKIAVASSDGIQVNESFGAAQRFLIYEIEGGSYHLLEKRESPKGNPNLSKKETERREDGAGCGCGHGGGCQGIESEKVRAIADCRCIVCTKIGFQAQKQLERKAVTAFDVSCSVAEALDKITYYFNQMDKHEVFRHGNE